MSDEQLAKNVLEFILLSAFSEYEIADILGTYVMTPEESDQYDDRQWEQLVDRVADMVRRQLIQAWRGVTL